MACRFLIRRKKLFYLADLKIPNICKYSQMHSFLPCWILILYLSLEHQLKQGPVMLTFWLRKRKFKKKKKKASKNVNILQYLSGAFFLLCVNWLITEIMLYFNSIFPSGKSPRKSSLRFLLLKSAFLKYIAFSFSYFLSNLTSENSILLWPISSTLFLNLHILSYLFSIN